VRDIPVGECVRECVCVIVQADPKYSDDDGQRRAQAREVVIFQAKKEVWADDDVDDRLHVRVLEEEKVCARVVPEAYVGAEGWWAQVELGSFFA